MDFNWLTLFKLRLAEKLSDVSEALNASQKQSQQSELNLVADEIIPSRYTYSDDYSETSSVHKYVDGEPFNETTVDCSQTELCCI